MQHVEHLMKLHFYVLFPLGYEGPNCEIDIDECAEHPCENDGECFERSDPSHWELEWELSFADAAGYICQCQPGFAGQLNERNLSNILSSHTSSDNKSLSRYRRELLCQH